MPDKERSDWYAAELTRRFEDLTKWAIVNWPRDDFPLLQSDFEQSRREIAQLLGEKLGDDNKGEDAEQRQGSNENNGSQQYIDMNPMPWP